MPARWIRHLLWRPFELGCRNYPLVPLRAEVTHPVDGVTCIRINNAVTRFLSRFGGGFDYAVSYWVDDTLLVDTGFPWARRCLRQTLIELGADPTARDTEFDGTPADWAEHAHHHELAAHLSALEQRARAAER